MLALGQRFNPTREGPVTLWGHLAENPSSSDTTPKSICIEARVTLQRNPASAGTSQAWVAHSVRPLWTGLPPRLGKLSHYKATDRLP